MDSMGKLISVEMDDDDQLDAPRIGGEIPMYPYGQRLSFDNATLVKLDLVGDLTSGQIERGDTLHLRCLAEVTSITHDQGGCRMELQITHYFQPIEDEDKEGGDADG